MIDGASSHLLQFRFHKTPVAKQKFNSMCFFLKNSNIHYNTRRSQWIPATKQHRLIANGESCWASQARGPTRMTSTHVEAGRADARGRRYLRIYSIAHVPRITSTLYKRSCTAKLLQIDWAKAIDQVASQYKAYYGERKWWIFIYDYSRSGVPSFDRIASNYRR